MLATSSATPPPFWNWGYRAHGSLDFDLAAFVRIFLSLQRWYIVIHFSRPSQDLSGCW